MMNETLKIMEERSSCGAFTDELPEKELLDAITKAAIESPSGTNAQPWKIITVTNKELLDEMEEETLNMMSKIPAYKGMYDTVTSMGIKLFYGAPCMIVLPYDKNNAYAKFDCGIVSQSISIAAQSLGVASHIIAINEVAFMGDKATYFKEKLQFPENYEFGLAVLLGKAAKTKAPHEPTPEKIVYIE
ncbi:MAG: nitroreductase family protein [Lachnospiraceae bacterium]|nr:nitroreductase family protein [Lachnospiraceae bacterium]MDD7379051.1 nitroreductase family protein [Lachnospiraceae bacterium]MDY4617534.1 nitroreductase family protein [Lachnospiraceae bacterium]